MRFFEKIDHKLREYRYKRSRNPGRYKNDQDLDIEGFLDELDDYVGEIMEEINHFLPKNRNK